MQSTIYIVDDDSGVRTSLKRLLHHHGHDVLTFDSGAKFLAQFDADLYGCVILDIAMPGLSGLEVQTKLLELECKMPIIFMTGHGDVPTSVRALKNGAVEFLEKPFPTDLLLERVASVLLDEKRRAKETTATAEILRKFSSLTEREADVMALLVAGFAARSNKEVARDMNISHRTVEIYRARIIEKMEATSLTHLVEMAKICGVYNL